MLRSDLYNNMHYVLLLRGINVGGSNRFEMPRLRALIEGLGCSNVSTYINTGNVFLESQQEQISLQTRIAQAIEEEFGLSVPILLKAQSEIDSIAAAIPSDWHNDTEYRADVAYLFPEIDPEAILTDLPFRQEYTEVHHTAGALLWRVKRTDYNRSSLSKIVGHRLYQLMTVRNVNTARKLASHTPT